MRAIDEERQQLINEVLRQAKVLETDGDAEELKGYAIGQYLRHTLEDTKPNREELRRKFD